MPPAAAAVGGLASLIGGAAAGAASVIGAVGSAGLSAVGGIAGTGASVLGGIVSGAGSLLFGEKPGLTTAQQMALEAEPGYYGTSGKSFLASLPAAASRTVDYLGNLIPTAAGIYQQFAPPRAEPARVGAVPLVPAPAISRSALPILGAQTPVYLRTGTPAPAPAIPNYLIYIGLAVLALFLLRKK